jgi:hypothetical protein
LASHIAVPLVGVVVQFHRSHRPARIRQLGFDGDREVGQDDLEGIARRTGARELNFFVDVEIGTWDKGLDASLLGTR